MCLCPALVHTNAAHKRYRGTFSLQNPLAHKLLNS
jgi:hypothetical protein